MGCRAAKDMRSSRGGTKPWTAMSGSPFSAHCKAFSRGVCKGSSFDVCPKDATLPHALDEYTQ